MNLGLGTLGFHLDGRPCRVGCEFCYLGARTPDPVRGPVLERTLDPVLLRELVLGVRTQEIAVAVSEPARRWRRGLAAIVQAAQERRLPVAITTTAAVVAADPWILDGAARLSVSIDPAKGNRGVDIADLAAALSGVPPEVEVIGLVSLASAEFCEQLASGLLFDLLALPMLSAVALNGIKPPPPWCDHRFWLHFLARIRPLLERHLHRRLHLDCYVNARILGLGPCPAKPDVSAGREFRSCVYQRAPDFVFAHADEFLQRTADYVPPSVCPFVIR